MALMWSQANCAFPQALYMPSIQTEAERTRVLVCAVHWMSFTCALCMQKSSLR